MNSLSKKIVVIFGGGGFVGKHLINHLKTEGYEVHVADINHPNVSDVIFHFCDVRKPILFNLNTPPYAVFNLAAVHRTPGHAPDDYYETNILGAINVLTWMETVDCQKLVFTSSISVYGPDNEIKDEDSSTQPIHSYGKSKLIAESIFRFWQQRNPSQRKLVICRPAVIFGEGENGNFTRMAVAISRNRFLIPTSQDTIKSSGYVKDLVRSLIFALEYKNDCIIFNFAFPTEYSIGDISSKVASIGKFKKPRVFNLSLLLKLALRVNPDLTIAKRAGKLLLPTRISPKFLIESNFEWQYNLNTALEDWFKTSEFDIPRFDSK